MAIYIPGLVTSTAPGLSSPQDKQIIDIAVVSDVSGVTGADRVVNTVSLTQAEYDNLVSTNPSTVYIITD